MNKLLQQPKCQNSQNLRFCSLNVNKINNESKQRKINAVTNNEYIFVQFDNVSHIVSIQLKTPFTVRCGCQTKSTIPEWCEHIVQALLYLSKEVFNNCWSAQLKGNEPITETNVKKRLKALTSGEMETLVLSLLYTDPRFVLNELERVEKEGNKVVVNNINQPGLKSSFNKN